MKKPKRLWAVMKAFHFESITVGGVPLKVPHDGPCRFIPLFETREDAVKHDGSDAYVLEIEAVEKGAA